VIALMWAVLVLLVHWAAAGLACGWDTSNCATSHDKNGLYQGVLDERRGEPFTNTPFTVAFESRRHAHPREVAGFSTDAEGRYCIVWAQERITPFAHVADLTRPIRGARQPLNGTDPPPGCQTGDQAIPWNRADDLRRSLQFLSVPAAVVPGMILLLVGLVGGASSRRAGVVLILTGTAVAALLWLA
jgi:hypothetical protein